MHFVKLHVVLFLLSVQAIVVFTQTKPNVVFILTDDLDARLGSLEYMPYLRQYIANNGATLANYFITNPICAPSRATILRGQYSHNHGVIRIFDENKQGLTMRRFQPSENSTLATWLKSAGYTTALIGKYMNGYGVDDMNYVPPGWDRWLGLYQNTNTYFNSVYSDQGRYTKKEGEYSTNTISSNAMNWIRQVTTDTPSKPFFLYMSPYAPHAPALHPAEYNNTFNNLAVPRVPSFNESAETFVKKPRFFHYFPYLTQAKAKMVDQEYKLRLRSLQVVDEMIKNVTELLTELNIINNTYIIFTSDNGYHMGHHRLNPWKHMSFEEDIKVPFFIRGPEIPKNRIINDVLTNIDIAPTICEIAGVTPPSFVDGLSFLDIVKKNKPVSRTKAFIELYNYYFAMNWSTYKSGDISIPRDITAVRQVNATHNILYNKWSTNETECYDLISDPYQLGGSCTHQIFHDKTAEFDLLTTKFHQCAGQSCRQLL